MGDLARVYEVVEGGLRMRLRVQPRSSRNRIAGVQGDALKVAVTAPPVEGAANAAVIALLAEVLDVPKRTISIVAGATGRDKQIKLETVAGAAVLARLEVALARVDKAKVGD